MTPPSLDKILYSCLKHSGTDVWVVAGAPPLLRFRDGVRQLSVASLRVEDVMSMVQPILSVKNREILKAEGRTTFDYHFRKVELFRVTIFHRLSATIIVFSRKLREVHPE